MTLLENKDLLLKDVHNYCDVRCGNVRSGRNCPCRHLKKKAFYRMWHFLYTKVLSYMPHSIRFSLTDADLLSLVGDYPEAVEAYIKYKKEKR